MKLVGPSKVAVEVPSGQERTVHVEAGDYYLLGRYGTRPNEYKYTKGDPFEVTQPAGKYSAITITLHKVIEGNYHAEPVSGKEFENFSFRDGTAQKINNSSDIFEAAREGNLDQISTFLGKENEINITKEDLDKLLYITAANGYIGVAKFLVQHGAKVNQVSESGLTPLHVAAAAGSMEMVTFLLANGSDIEAQTENFSRPLHVAVMQDQLAVAKILLEHGANVNSRAGYLGGTPLEFALDNQNKAMIKFLRDKGGVESPKLF